MSGREDIGQDFIDYSLNAQIGRCRSNLDDITESVFDGGDVDQMDIVNDVSEEIDDMESSSVEIFTNPDRIADINRSLRRILISIAEFYEYDQKLYKPNNTMKDDLSNLFYWFRLYSLPNVNGYSEIEFEYVIHECRHLRNGIEHGGRSSSNRPDVVALGILAWYVLEELLHNWHLGQRQNYPNRQTEFDNSGNSYGFIYNVEGLDATITSYSNGEADNKIPFEVGETDFYPSTGDIVSFDIVTQGGSNHAENVTRL